MVLASASGGAHKSQAQAVVHIRVMKTKCLYICTAPLTWIAMLGHYHGMGIMISIVLMLLIIQHSRVLHMTVRLLCSLPQRPLLIALALLQSSVSDIRVCRVRHAIGRICRSHACRIGSQLDSWISFAGLHALLTIGWTL